MFHMKILDEFNRIGTKVSARLINDFPKGEKQEKYNEIET